MFWSDQLQLVSTQLICLHSSLTSGQVVDGAESGKRIPLEPVFEVVAVFTQPNRQVFKQLQADAELGVPVIVVLLDDRSVLWFFREWSLFDYWELLLVFADLVDWTSHIEVFFVRNVVIHEGEPASVDV